MTIEDTLLNCSLKDFKTAENHISRTPSLNSLVEKGPKERTPDVILIHSITITGIDVLHTSCCDEEVCFWFPFPVVMFPNHRLLSRAVMQWEPLWHEDWMFADSHLCP